MNLTDVDRALLTRRFVFLTLDALLDFVLEFAAAPRRLAIKYPTE